MNSGNDQHPNEQDPTLEHNVSRLIGARGELPKLSQSRREQILENLLAEQEELTSARLTGEQSSTSSSRWLHLLQAAAVLLLGVAGAAVWQMTKTSEPVEAVTPTGIAGSLEPDSGSNTLPVPAKPRFTSRLYGTVTETTMADGTVIVAEKNTKFTITGPRALSLTSGRLYLIVHRNPEDPFRVLTTDGEALAMGTRFAVSVMNQETSVAVAQGKVRLSNRAGSVDLHRGDEGKIIVSRKPRRKPAPRVSYLVNWAREALAQREKLADEGAKNGPRENRLVAKDPNGQEVNLSLHKYHVDVFIEDGIARTTIDQTFFNHLGGRTEGIFYFPLAPDASISRLAMYVKGVLNEGGMVERSRGQQIYDGIKYQNRDPALLEMMEGNVCKLRIFPLEGREERRIFLSYTQSLEDLYGTLRYWFPMDHTHSKSGELSIRVRIKDGAEKYDSRSSTHDLEISRDGADLILDYKTEDARPDQDFLLHLLEKKASKDLKSAPQLATFRQSDQNYVYARVTPDFSDQRNRLQPDARQWIVLNDMSASRTDLERRAQVHILERILAEADDFDRLALIQLNTRAKLITPELLPIRGESARKVVGELRQARLIGGTNLEAGLKRAAAFIEESGARNPVILYLGDGIATDGERSAERLASLIPKKTAFVGIGVGKKADTRFFRAASNRSGGSYFLMNPSEDLNWRVFDMMASFSTPRLRDISWSFRDSEGKEIHLDAHLERSSVAEGESLVLIGRTDEELPAELDIQGRIDGNLFQQSVNFAEARNDAAYLPRFWATREIDSLIHKNPQFRGEVVALSKQFYVLTPYTSLIVLEDDKMYKEFNVEKGRSDHWALYPAPEKIPVVHIPRGKNPREFLKRKQNKEEQNEQDGKGNDEIAEAETQPTPDPEEGAAASTKEDLEKLIRVLLETIQFRSDRPMFYARGIAPSAITPLSSAVGAGKKFYGFRDEGFAGRMAGGLFTDPGMISDFRTLSIGGQLQGMGYGGAGAFDPSAIDGIYTPISATGFRGVHFLNTFGRPARGSGGRQFRSERDFASGTNLAGGEWRLDYGYPLAGTRFFAQGNFNGLGVTGIQQYEMAYRMQGNNGLLNFGPIDMNGDGLSPLFEYDFDNLGYAGAARIVDWSGVTSFDDYFDPVGISTWASPTSPLTSTADGRWVTSSNIDNSITLWNSNFPGSQLLSSSFWGDSYRFRTQTYPSAYLRQLQQSAAIPAYGFWSAFVADALARQRLKEANLIEFGAELGSFPFFPVDFKGLIEKNTDLVRTELLGSLPDMYHRVENPALVWGGRAAASPPVPGGFHPPRQYAINEHEWVFDLTRYAPGLQNNALDVMDLLETSLAQHEKPTRGSIDEKARAKITAARASLTPERISGNKKPKEENQSGSEHQASPSILVTPDGSLAATHRTAMYLEERIFSDGPDLFHVYPELGLASRRPLSSLRKAALGQLTPHWVPTIDSLTRSANVRLLSSDADGFSLRLDPIELPGKDAKEQPPTSTSWTQLRVRSDGRLSRVSHYSQDEISGTTSFEYVDSGQVTISVRKAKGELTTKTTFLSTPVELSQEGSEFAFDRVNMVIFDMPLLTADQYKRKAGSEKESLTPKQLIQNHRHRALAQLQEIARSQATTWQYLQGVNNEAITAMSKARELMAQIGQAPKRGDLTLMLGVEKRGDFKNKRNQKIAYDGVPEDYAAKIKAYLKAGKSDLEAMASSGPSLLAHLAGARMLVKTETKGVQRSLSFIEQWPDSSLLFLAAVSSNHPDSMVPLLNHPQWQVDAMTWMAKSKKLTPESSEKLAQSILKWHGQWADEGLILPLGGQLGKFLQNHDGQKSLLKLRQKSERAAEAKKDAGTWLQLAELAVSTRQSGAIDYALEKARSLMQEDQAALFALSAARIRWAAGETKTAQAHFTSLLDVLEKRKVPPSPGLLAISAHLARILGDVDEFVKLEVESIELDLSKFTGTINKQYLDRRLNTLWTALLKSAQDAVRSGDPAQKSHYIALCKRISDRWIEITPHRTSTLVDIASLYENSGDHETAWMYASTVIDLKPVDARSYGDVASWYTTHGENDLAQQMLGHAFECDTANPAWLKARMERLYHMGRSDEGDALFRQLHSTKWPPALQRGVPRQARRFVIPMGNQAPNQWKMRKQKPEEDNWFAVNYDDNGWDLASTPLVAGAGSAADHSWKTPIESKEVWLRSEFELKDNTRTVHLRTISVGKVQIFINGSPTDRFETLDGEMRTRAISSSNVTQLKVGKNTIAIHFRPGGGDRARFDLGVTHDLLPDPEWKKNAR